MSQWLRAHDSRARVLVKLPGRTPGEVKRFLDRIHPTAAPDDGIAAELSSSGAAAVVRKFELPEGRRYALMGQPASATAGHPPATPPATVARPDP